MEVLISTGVLSVGLLALAALLPVGGYTIFQTIKADRAGDCGRAGLHEVRIRRMLDPQNWSATPSSNSFMIDPLGVPTLGNVFPSVGGSLSRISLNNCLPDAFVWRDDLVVMLPEEMTPPQPRGRSRIFQTSGVDQPKGDYTWFASATRTADPSQFVVSIVVCFKRDLQSPERSVAVASTGFLDAVPLNNDPNTRVAYGGGSIQLNQRLNDATSGIRVAPNDWVALVSGAGAGEAVCQWYRVVAITDDPTSTTQYLTLNGPDWRVADSNYVVALGQSVIGVYTTTVDVDEDPVWGN